MKWIKIYLTAVGTNSLLKGKNTKEIYDSMGEVSRHDALRDISMIKWGNEWTHGHKKYKRQSCAERSEYATIM